MEVETKNSMFNGKKINLFLIHFKWINFESLLIS